MEFAGGNINASDQGASVIEVEPKKESFGFGPDS